MEPEQCRLAGTVFLGTIVVTNDSKSEKKKCTQEETGDEGSHKKQVEGKKWSSRVFKEAWNTSHFAAAKDPSLQLSYATQQGSVVRCGEGLASQR